MLKTLQRYKSDNALAYSKSGAGLPIVLVHGVGLRAESWAAQIEMLSQTHTVYAVDMPGHGESLLLEDCAGLEAYVDAIANWIKAEINQPVIMMGHSMGSMIALNFAMRYSKFCTGVVALNSVYRRTAAAKSAVQQRALQMLENPESVTADAPITRWFTNTADDYEQQMAELCRQWLNNAPKVGYAKAYTIFSSNDGPRDEDLAALNVPTLFATGDGDSNSSPEMSQQMSSLCQKGSFAVIKNARHMVQMTHPQQVNQLLQAFVVRCEN
jgi:pimeloyl-ACP methyl ester carboxylesterase